MEHRTPTPEEAERQARRLAERIGMRLGLPDSASGVRRYVLLDRRGQSEMDWQDIGQCIADLRHLAVEGCRA